MSERITQQIRKSYDRLADEYAHRIFNELQHKPLDRELLDCFAAKIVGRGEGCDMGCGPGQVARHLPGIALADQESSGSKATVFRSMCWQFFAKGVSSPRACTPGNRDTF